jgi:phospholipid/cholesterol/gamma-HCH transport system permease protein
VPRNSGAVHIKLIENAMARQLARLGHIVLVPVLETGRMGVFLGRMLLTTAIPPLKLGRILKRVQFFGFQSLVVILLTGLFTGMVLGYQGFYTLLRVGSSAFLGPMVALSLLRELGPVITALMVTARAGSAVCAEIGIMRINE